MEEKRIVSRPSLVHSARIVSTTLYIDICVIRINLGHIIRGILLKVCVCACGSYCSSEMGSV